MWVTVPPLAGSATAAGGDHLFEVIAGVPGGEEEAVGAAGFLQAAVKAHFSVGNVWTRCLSRHTPAKSSRV